MTNRNNGIYYKLTATGFVSERMQNGISISGAYVAQSVEHVLGKDEVTGSIPVVGSILSNYTVNLKYNCKTKRHKRNVIKGGQRWPRKNL